MNQIESLKLIKEKIEIEAESTTGTDNTLLVEVECDKHSEFIFLPRMSMTYGIYSPARKARLLFTMKVWYELIATDSTFMDDMSAPRAVDMFADIALKTVNRIRDDFNRAKVDDETLKNIEFILPTRGSLTSLVLNAVQTVS